MDIYEALKFHNLRVSGGNRWACLNEFGTWIVYERLYNQKFTRTIIETPGEEEAMRHLVESL